MKETNRHGTEKIEKRTWYGLKATIISGPGFLHTAGFGFFLIPHPPVINWLLRQRLTEKNRRMLTHVHEFQHFQSAPFILIYMLFFVVLAAAFGRMGVRVAITLLVSTQALWEICAETFTIISDAQFYHNAYANVSAVPRIIFWTFTCGLTLAVWIVVGFEANLLF